MYNKSLAIIFITLFFTVTFLTNHIFSQSPAGLILGISGEVGSSSQKLTDDYLLVQQFRAEDSKSTLAYGLGVNVGVRLGNFSFITGGSYIRRGGGTDAEILGRNYTPRNPSATSPGPDLEVIVEDRLSLNLLRVPFLLGYQFGSDNFKFRISAGLGWNYGIGDKAIFTRNATWKDPNNLSVDINDVESDQDGFGVGHTYGDLSTDRFKKSFVSFILAPDVLFKINENGFIKLGVLYESYGRIVNDKFVINNNPPDGTTSMSSFNFQIGYEYRLDFGGGTF